MPLTKNVLQRNLMNSEEVVQPPEMTSKPSKCHQKVGREKWANLKLQGSVGSTKTAPIELKFCMTSYFISLNWKINGRSQKKKNS